MYLRAGGRKTGAIRPNREKNTRRESSQWEVGISPARMIKTVSPPAAGVRSFSRLSRLYIMCELAPFPGTAHRMGTEFRKRKTKLSAYGVIVAQNTSRF